MNKNGTGVSNEMLEALSTNREELEKNFREVSTQDLKEFLSMNEKLLDDELAKLEPLARHVNLVKAELGRRNNN